MRTQQISYRKVFMKKVLVIGAARTGAAAAKLLLENGSEVVLTDNREPEAISREFPEAAGDLKDLAEYGGDRFETVFGEQFPAGRAGEFDLIVVSPGVPPTIPVLREADKLGVDAVTDLEVACRLSPAAFVAITGTNGKTTTTTLAGEIFDASGRTTRVVGNIGLPVSRWVRDSKPEDVFVTEISAFQLDGIREFKPKAALVLNLSPDHLDRYQVMDNYVNAKKRICMNQDAEDFLVLNQDDPLVREFGSDSPVRKLFISTQDETENGACYLDGTLYITENGNKIPLVTDSELGIKGIHNVQNALGASALAYFSGVDIDVIRKVLKEFTGVEHRQEYICTRKGVRYVNDSKGTNTNAAIIALNAMTSPVVLIAGGYDKHEDYTEFVETMKGKVRELILFGVTADNIEETCRRCGFNNVIRTDGLEHAVQTAASDALSGDTVLLSPACASWDMFDNYEVRGDEFRKLSLALPE